MTASPSTETLNLDFVIDIQRPPQDTVVGESFAIGRFVSPSSTSASDDFGVSIRQRSTILVRDGGDLAIKTVKIKLGGQLVDPENTAEPLTPIALDGEVTSAAEILEVVNDVANSGKSYYMRDGDYGEMTIGVDARPTSLITFITYPDEQVRFGDVSIGAAANIRFDGNEFNTNRIPAVGPSGYPAGHYGLWFRGSGIGGNNIPNVKNCLTFPSSRPPLWTENIQFANFRLGDDAAGPTLLGPDSPYFPGLDVPWRRQQGIVILDGTRELLFEDFEISYIGLDQSGEGDFQAGGYGIWWFAPNPGGPEWGNYTFRRGHFHHTANDFVQYGPKNVDDGLVLFENCLFEALYNYGGAHADLLQNVGGTSRLLYEGCVFQYCSDFLLHGNNPGATRTFHNCLFGNPNDQFNVHQIVCGKDDEISGPGFGASDYEWRDCTLNLLINGIRTDSVLGASFTSNLVMTNSIYTGFGTSTGVDFEQVWTNEGSPNVFVEDSFGGKLSTDITDTPVYNAQGECTNYSQGWRKPADFPWALTQPEPAPTNALIPFIIGSATVGLTLASTTGVWFGEEPITYSYQWQRDGVDIVGATASTYLLVSGDAAHTVRCQVAASNSSGAAEANTNGKLVASVVATASSVWEAKGQVGSAATSLPWEARVSSGTPVSSTVSAPWEARQGVTASKTLPWEAASGGIPDPTGEVTSAAELIAAASDDGNAGTSFWMRGGDYGTLTMDAIRPPGLITFITYPGEQVTFEDVNFTDTANLRFDGNVDNMTRELASQGGDFPDGDYGLWFIGSGIAGNFIPDVGNCITFNGSSSDAWNQNLQFANFRLGDVMGLPIDGGTDTPWRRQHGIVIAYNSTDLVFEDFEIAYIGLDQSGEGDFSAGGFGVWWFSTEGDTPEWGNYTFRRGHFHHTNNDFVQYGPKNPDDGLVLFEDCLFEELTNYGGAHADLFQALGGSTQLTYESCVFQFCSDFLLHGDNPGATRLFHNCLFGNPNHVYNVHQIVLGKDDEGGASDYEWRDCTLNLETNGIRTDSTHGSSFTSNFVLANSIYTGVQTSSSTNFALVFSTAGQPNKFVTGSTDTMLSGDSSGTPTYNAEGECTNFSQGYRKSSTFPWSLAPPPTLIDSINALAPLAYWRTVSGTDETANNLDLTPFNTPTAGTSLDASDGSNGSMVFDGSNNLWNPEHYTDFDLTTNFSMFFLFKPTGTLTGSTRDIVGKGAFYGVRLGTDAKLHAFIRKTVEVEVAASAVSVAGTTYSVGMTYDGANLKLYVNGALDATTATTGAVDVSNGTSFTIALGPDGGIVGSVDEVALFDSVLTAGDFADLHAAAT